MQTINRNNYEEFFLLYVDGELNATQRLAVENFVQQNPDLAVELEMILNTKLAPEVVEFDNKENLLRTEGHSINETNYEEYFLLYIDNELSTAKREEVEMYVLKHPQLQDEFITLKQAVLTPELISYGDKQDLYRKEKRRIIYLKPWRFAAAAVFIGVCAIGIWMMQRTNNTINDVAVNPSTQNKPASTVPQIADTDTVKQAPQQPVDIAQQPAPVKKEKKTQAITAASKKKDNNVVAQKAINTTMENAQEEVVIKRPVIIHNNIAKEQKEPPVDINKVTADVPGNPNSTQIDVAALQKPEINTAEGNNRVYTVAYKEINTNDDDRSLHVGMLDLNKDKVRTLFKKAGRMFGSKPNDPTDRDGKLQVANFEIDTKNNN